MVMLTKKEQVLSVLSDGKNHDINELCKITHRFGSCIHELRKEGYQIKTIKKKYDSCYYLISGDYSHSTNKHSTTSKTLTTMNFYAIALTNTNYLSDKFKAVFTDINQKEFKGGQFYDDDFEYQEIIDFVDNIFEEKERQSIPEITILTMFSVLIRVVSYLDDIKFNQWIKDNRKDELTNLFDELFRYSKTIEDMCHGVEIESYEIVSGISLYLCTLSEFPDNLITKITQLKDYYLNNKKENENLDFDKYYYDIKTGNKICSINPTAKERGS